MADEEKRLPAKSEAVKSKESTAGDKLASEIVERRQASLRYFNENFYEEFAEIYRNINARTKPHTVWNHREHKFEEDRSGRTNVCVPDHFVMLRRGTSRLTRNPPNLRVRGGPEDQDDDKAQANRDKVSAKLMFDWDRSDSQRAFKRVVNVAYGLGWGVGKVYYDEVSVVRKLRRLTSTLRPKDFDNLANAKDPKIAGMVSRFGDQLKDPTPFSPEEQAAMITEMGDETALNQSSVRYRGPILDAPWIGDIFPEAGFKSLNQSGYVIENSLRDEDWLKYWTKQTSINPITGEEAYVMDAKVCQAVLDKSQDRTHLDEQEMSLRRRLREEIDISDPTTAGKPLRAPRKRVMIDEQHTIVDGHLCIDFVGEESEYLGRLWYPWETYGKYTFAEMVLLPDWLGGIGQSTLRVTRFLLELRNTRLNQTTDFINNILLPLLKKRRGEDTTEYDIVRTGFARILELDDMNSFEFQQDPTLPNAVWQDQAQYSQMMQQVDPSTVDYSPGTADAPGPGKFATTARLADKAADSVTADTLDQVGMFIRDVVELSLWMSQQAMNESQKVPQSYLDRINPPKPPQQKIEAESINTEGAQARVIDISPYDIQEDYEVLPEQGSTLAADDEFRVAGLQQFMLIAERHGDIVNLRAVITALARATPGINAEDIILPPPPPTPPVPPVKLNISLSIKWEELAPDVQAAILQHEGLPTDITHVQGVEKMVGKLRTAADNASELEAPVDHTPQAPQPAGGTNGSSNGKPKGKEKPKAKV